MPVGCRLALSTLLFAGITILPALRPAPARAQVEVWLTNPDGSALFARQQDALPFGKAEEGRPVIKIDPAKTFQTIDGFGYTLTGGSAGHLRRMTAPRRAALLKELFGVDDAGIGVSYLRLSIGASDLNDRVYSYDDLPAGQTDPNMARFSLAPDRADVIPVLKEILKIAPDLKLMASPWSPPVWMKTNRNSVGGSLKPEAYPAYAKYFVRYVRDMKADGIRIDAVTVQNEPLHGGNNPSCVMTAAEQLAFVKSHLGPAFRAAKLDTKIVVYDHNCDKPEYPLSILDDPQAKAFVDGSAFHLYAGKIDAMSKVHDAHPDRSLYFTEQWMGAPANPRGDLPWHVREVVIGSTRNWSRVALEWNLAADPKQNPHTKGGCDKCLGALTIDGDKVTRNPAYYVIAHAAKFVRPGSVRIASDVPPSLPNVAFKAPDGRTVLIVLCDNGAPQTFNIEAGGRLTTATLPPGSVGTFVWK